jgi:hypothetical protein
MIKTFEQFVSTMYGKTVDEAFQNNNTRKMSDDDINLAETLQPNISKIIEIVENILETSYEEFKYGGGNSTTTVNIDDNSYNLYLDTKKKYDVTYIDVESDPIMLGDDEYVFTIQFKFSVSENVDKISCNMYYNLESFQINGEEGSVTNNEIGVTLKTYKELFDTRVEKNVECGDDSINGFGHHI